MFYNKRNLSHVSKLETSKLQKIFPFESELLYEF